MFGAPKTPQCQQGHRVGSPTGLFASVSRADISAQVCSYAPQSIPDGQDTALKFDSVQWDRDKIFHLALPTKLTANTPGQYLVFGTVFWSSGAPPISIRNISIRKHGQSGHYASAHTINATEFGQGNKASIAAKVHLELNEIVELVVFQNTGGPVDIAGGCIGAHFGMVKVP
jgi:hypothetical protein